MRVFWLVGLAVLAGCSAVPEGKAPNAVSLPGAPLAFRPLDLSDSHHLRLQQFLSAHPSPSEQDKIAYLLGEIRASDIVFIRNGDRFSGDQAARWLRWKITHRQYRNNPIRTAEDFVTRVANGSVASGLPYQVVFSDGSHAPLKDLLVQELASLEQEVHNLMLETQVTQTPTQEAATTAAIPLAPPAVLAPGG